MEVFKIDEMRVEGWYTQDEIASRFRKKAESLLDAIRKAGYSGFYISTSVTHFGVSVYIQGNYGVKFRLSDHSVTNTGRLMDEEHITLDTTEEYVLDVIENAVETAKMRTAAFDRERERIASLDAKWQSVKDRFDGLTFKHCDRTYQDMETFIRKGEENGVRRTNIYQKEIGTKYGEKAYYYEWTEPVSSNELPKKKPSYEYIDAFL